MRSFRFVLVALLMLLAASASANGPYQPPVSNGCVDCTVDWYLMVVECEATSEPTDMRWSGCAGGWYCDTMPGGGTVCMPDCGARCMYV